VTFDLGQLAVVKDFQGLAQVCLRLSVGRGRLEVISRLHFLLPWMKMMTTVVVMMMAIRTDVVVDDDVDNDDDLAVFVAANEPAAQCAAAA
jgi:hypothetical protein